MGWIIGISLALVIVIGSGRFVRAFNGLLQAQEYRLQDDSDLLGGGCGAINHSSGDS